MNRTELASAVIAHYEGEKLVAHQVNGTWHVGIGHNLEIEQTPEELEAMGIDKLPADLDGFSITREQSDALFEIDLSDAIDDLSPAFTADEIEEMDDARAVVLISMTYQLGGRGIRKFKNFIAAVKAGNFNQASAEMLYADPASKRMSAWYNQTPERCRETAEAMKTGIWERFQGEPKVFIIDEGEPRVRGGIQDEVSALRNEVEELKARVSQLEQKTKKKVWRD